MALSNPPCEPGGRVMWVNTVSCSDDPPRQTSVTRIEASNARPMMVASTQAASITRLDTRRRRDSRFARAGSRCGERPGRSSVVALMVNSPSA